ncbi:DUF192 domain-containing protein [Oxalobacteraceae bacterium R-40]|uniref:DUF192 domain-containing protein n=1 Tax=Keguizhuia sedimenti TaxID=3064264 RepID=A0ABU1BLF5_9BURK|nr:DUF192 domain-containing protein [Oxalobacteraceae bacterium R-40]
MHISSIPYFRCISAAFVALLASTNVSAQNKLPTVQLTAGMHVIQAEVAATEGARQQGLMNRQTMGPNEGMLFVFDRPAGVCMWMKNTPLPLSVAFIDQAGKIVNIEDMQPNTTDSHCAKKLIRYALEMNQSWFKQKNIKPGTTIEGLPR